MEKEQFAESRLKKEVAFLFFFSFYDQSLQDASNESRQIAARPKPPRSLNTRLASLPLPNFSTNSISLPPPKNLAPFEGGTWKIRVFSLLSSRYIYTRGLSKADKEIFFYQFCPRSSKFYSSGHHRRIFECKSFFRAGPGIFIFILSSRVNFSFSRLICRARGGRRRDRSSER